MRNQKCCKWILCAHVMWHRGSLIYDLFVSAQKLCSGDNQRDSKQSRHYISIPYIETHCNAFPLWQYAIEFQGNVFGKFMESFNFLLQ